MQPFRLGTTSYILPDDILPNVRYLADKMQDVELVLFEVDDEQNNLPSSQVITELAALAEAHDLTYTVHLPLDLRLAAGGEESHRSLTLAQAVIERTRSLNPWAYVLHLDGRKVIAGATPAGLQSWQDQAVRALELVAGWLGDAGLLAVENLDHYPPDFIHPVIARIPVSRCVDVGHLWLEGHDPLPYLEAALPRTRVIHLHGIGERDHQSIARMPQEKLDGVLGLLVEAGYSGVVTMEIFGKEDFFSSRDAVLASLRRLAEGRDR